MTAYRSGPEDRAFDFDATLHATLRPPLHPGGSPPAAQAFSWRDLAGLLTAVAAVPAIAMVVMFAAVTTYGPAYLADHPVQIAATPIDVETTGSIAWQLRDTFDD